MTLGVVVVRRGVQLVWLCALAACAPALDDTPSEGRDDAADTDPPIVGDTDRVDPDPADTDRVDPDPADTDTTDTDPADTDTHGPRWTSGGVVTCADPSVRTTTPYVAWDPPGDWQDQNLVPDAPPQFAGGGVTVIDLDGDGVLDLLRTSAEGDFHWLTLDPAGPVDRTGELPPMPAETSAVIPVDYDGDGDLDLHVIVWRGPDLLLRQDAPGVFTDVAPALGLDGPAGEDTVSSSWADADGDGDLDVFVAVYGKMTANNLPDGEPSHLYLQEADGTFTDLLPTLSINDMIYRAHTFQGVWMEIDGDPSTPELYVVNDFGHRWPNRAYKVVGGQWVQLGMFGFEAANTCMGVAVGDLSDDGVDDIVLTALGTIDSFVSVAGNWYRTVGIGLDPDDTRGQFVGWGAELADQDNDGDLDLFAGFGQLDPAVLSGGPAYEEPDGMWRNDGGRFTDIAPALGLDHLGLTRGLLAVDLNHDGWLDVVRQDLAGPATVHMASCGAEAWLEVALRDVHGRNTSGVGARIVVVDGAKTWAVTVRAGGRSFQSAAPMEAHFGLGLRDEVDRVEVHWPDGGVDTLTQVPTRQRLLLDR